MKGLSENLEDMDDRADLVPLIDVLTELVRTLESHTHCALVNYRGSHGVGDLGAETEALSVALQQFGRVVSETAAEYRRAALRREALVDPFPPSLSTGPLAAGPLALGAALTGSFLSGMSLTWLFLLRFGVDVGIAFGDSDLLGTVVVAAVYLYLVQVVLLGGYVLTLVLAGRTGPGSVGPVVPGHPVDQLAQDVDVPGVAGRLLDHVDQDPAHGHRFAEPGRAGVLQPDLVDDAVGGGPGPAVEGQNVGGRLPRFDP